MEELSREFVRRREALRRTGQGFRVPKDLRVLAVRFVRWAVAGGESVAGAAEQLGVSRGTLERWLAAEPESSASAVREVVVLDAGESEGAASVGGLRLVTPEGFRIEGLELGELVELVRSLR